MTPLSWQLKQQQQHQSQPSSFSMQLQPATNTDSGNIKLPHEVAEQLSQAHDDASEPGSTMRQVCSSEECHGRLLSQSALSTTYARQADTCAVGGADATHLAGSSTLRTPGGRTRFLANAAGGSIDSDMMASWPDATAGGRHPMAATGVSVKDLPPQDHQVRFKVSALTGPCAVHAVRWPSTQCVHCFMMNCLCTQEHASLRSCVVASCGSNDHCLYADFLHIPAASQTCADAVRMLPSMLMLLCIA